MSGEVLLDTCSELYFSCLHTKGLITKYREGGNTMGGGAHMKFYPYAKGGKKSFSHAEGGGDKKFGGNFHMVA